MNDLVDLHNHVLPIDDGAKDHVDAIKMLRDAVESKISTVFVTPHMIPGGKYDPSVELITNAFEALKVKVSEEDIPVELKLASEFQINSEAMDAIHLKKYICYEDTDYLLVEFVRRNMHFHTINHALEELSFQGVKIVIAHPERYFDNVDEALSTCHKWVKQGYVLQVNRTSLLKEHFPLQRKIALKLINENLIQLIASDAHHAKGKRRLRLDDSYRLIQWLFGKRCAILLHKVNPKRLMNNEPLIKMQKVRVLRMHLIRWVIKYLY